MKIHDLFFPLHESEGRDDAASDFRQAQCRHVSVFNWWHESVIRKKDVEAAELEQAELYVHFFKQMGHVVSPKLLYLVAVHTLDRDRLQRSWGRIQQQGEVDYELIVSLLARHRKRERLTAQQLSRRHALLEEFEGFVEQIDGNLAYVTLKDKAGQTLYGEYPASELETLGIHERRRFRCRTFDVGDGNVRIELSAVPDRKVSEEHQRAIDEELRRTMGGDDGPEDDY